MVSENPFSGKTYFYTIHPRYLLSQEGVCLLLHVEVDHSGELLLPNLQPRDSHVVLNVLERPPESLHGLAELVQFCRKLARRSSSRFLIGGKGEVIVEGATDLGPNSIEKFWLEVWFEKPLELWLDMKIFING